MRKVLAHRGTALLAVVMVAVGVLAALHRGVAVADLDLNDGGVWVTNGHDHLVAHLNYPSRTLDGGLRSTGAEFDVSQSGNEVVLHDLADSSAASISPATLALGTPLKAGAGWQEEHAGTTVAVLDPTGGRFWVFGVDQIGSFSPDSTPVAEGLVGARLAVGTDGQALVLSTSGAVTRYGRSTDGWKKSDAGHVDGYRPSDSVDLTTVGNEIAVLDRGAGKLLTTHGSTDVGPDAQLQLPGGARDTVAVAAPGGLISVPLSGGDAKRRTIGDGSAGKPARPAVVGGCLYAAWAGTGQYVRDCTDNSDDRSQQVSQLASAGSLLFRSNRDVVVLNDVTNGNVFLVNKGMAVVNNWNDIQNQIQDQEHNDQKTSDEQIASTQAPHRSDKNTPPTAVPDSFGVRPGRSTDLPVLANDSDPDGDVLEARLPARDPGVGHLAQIRGGTALQIGVPADATGAASFAYTADDGRGGTASANVSLTVRPFSVNDPPAQLKKGIVTLEQRAEVQYDALQDWFDPDGDPVYVESAIAPDGMEVRSRPDGMLVIHDLGTASIGRKDLTVIVSDGRAETNGTITLNVLPRSNAAPTANADHVQVLRGRSIDVSPLANDTDPSGDALRLTTVGKGKGDTTIVPHYAAGTFTYTSREVGTQYIDYSISDGPNAASSVVRVDVIDPDDQTLSKPVADNDIALLPSGGSVTIHPLANDSDPKGGVLVVQSVESAGDLEQKGLSVGVMNQELLRITAPRGLAAPTSFTYTVSNGVADASAQVTVVPLPPAPVSAAPVTAPDAATVRAGDIATVAVLANDRSPGGSALRLDSKLHVEGTSLGTVFVSANNVRVMAGAKPGRMRVIYTVWDTFDNYSSGQVTFTVTANDGHDSPPSPPALVARTIAGSSVHIPVPLTGIDVDGDSVTLVGIDTPPTSGRVEVQGNDLVYHANEQFSGTAHFTYRVQDTFGQSAVGTVDVGVARPSQADQAPIAVTDSVIARTSRELSIPVLANDFDPDGDSLSVVGGSVVPVDPSTTIGVELVDSQVHLTTPGTPGVLRYYYEVSDGHGGKGRGVVVVKVQTDAPLLAPIAADDTVSVDEIADKPDVTVDVLANDSDPDGNFRSLTVDTDATDVEVTGDSKLVIPVGEKRRVVLYTVTDADHLTSDAVVVVPGSRDVPPRLKPGATVTVKGGETAVLPLADYVLVRSGHSPVITVGAKVSSTGGSQGPLVKDPRTLQFSATRDFSGTTSIVFEVTDGTDANDRDGLVSTLSLPVTVTPAAGRPPVFRPSQVVTAAGEAAVRVDLGEMATDPDPGDDAKLRFLLGAVPAGITASVQGSELSVSAPVDAEVGSSFLLPATVTDGTTAPVSAQIPVSVSASTRPLMEVTPAAIPDANAGKPSTLDVKDYVANPFAADGKPITLVGRPGVASGTGSVTANGTFLSITPATGFHGTMSVAYTVADATNTPSRYVSGVVNLTVRDVPDSPTSVDATTGASQSATVTWQAPANNGAAIDGYTVTWTVKSAGSAGPGSSGSQDCGQVTACTIDTLTNDVTYTFTVTARNVVGASKPSSGSRDVRPDVKPDTPLPPSIQPCSDAKPCDKQLTVSWTAPHTEGSAVTGYVLQISGPTSGPTEKEVTGTSTTWTGLTNGDSYTFQVQAKSKAEEPSDFSTASGADSPAGVPESPEPQVSNNASSPNPPASIKVSWAPPEPHGDPVMTYEVRENENDSTERSAATATFQDRSYGAGVADDKQFQVRAHNKSGWSEWSAPSQAVRPFQAPGPVTGLSASPTGQNNTVSITFGAAAGNGARPDEMSYVWSANGQEGTLPAGGGVVTSGAFPNGQSVTVSVRARSTVRDQTVDGQSQSAPSFTPYGPPTAPNVSATGGVNTVRLCWDASSAGNGKPVLETHVQTSSGDLPGGQPVSGCVDQGNGRNQSWSIQAQVRTDAGWGPWSAAVTASTWGNKQFVVETAPGTCTKGTDCQYVHVRLINWDPNSSGHCYAGGVGFPDWQAYPTTDGAGNSGWYGDSVLHDSAAPYRFTRGTHNAGDNANGLTCT